jgi:hypothetical protein
MSDDLLAMKRQEAGLLLRRFVDPALVAHRSDMVLALRPRHEDYAAVFAGDAAAAARAGYEGLWSNPPRWPIRPEQTALRVECALSDDFATGRAGAISFPGGYRAITRHLIPGRIWVCWEFLAPTARDGLAFDGLVEVGDRWAWFPKPWRVLP